MLCEAVTKRSWGCEFCGCKTIDDLLCSAVLTSGILSALFALLSSKNPTLCLEINQRHVLKPVDLPNNSSKFEFLGPPETWAALPRGVVAILDCQRIQQNTRAINR